MAEVEKKRVTLHPLRKDGSIDTSINLYPKTFLDGIVNREGDEVEVALKEEIPTDVVSHEELEDDLSFKQDTLISGENIKTINNESILGKGNITVNVDVDDELSTTSENPVQNKVITQELQNTNTSISDEISRAESVESQLGGEIDDINELIPSQASTQNKLTDKDFVNSSIATNTAYFKGTFNIVTDLELTVDATHAQVASALLSEVVNPTNNDYVFVSYPDTIEPTQFTKFERYKYNSLTQTWSFEFELNNSSFTAEQWASINSGITAQMINNFVTTNTEQTIAVDKTLDNNTNTSPKIKFTSSYTTGQIYQDGWDFTISSSAKIGGNRLYPITSNYADLGTSSRKWKDIYLSGNIILQDANSVHYYTLNSNSYGNFNLAFDGTSVLSINNTNGMTIKNNLLPSTTATHDLGSSSYAWKDIYVTTIKNQEGTEKIDVSGGAIVVNNILRPKTNNARTLGTSSYTWKDLHLGHAINPNTSGYGLTLPDTSGFTADSQLLDTASNQDIIGVKYIRNTNDQNLLIFGDKNNLNLRILGQGGTNFVVAAYRGNTLLRYLFRSYTGFACLAPNADLGEANGMVRDIYMSRNLTDGTHSVNVADLAALIAYAKAQGWIS